MTDPDVNNIFFTTIIKKAIVIEPNKQNQNLRAEIDRLVKEEFEGKCIEEGYVSPGTLQITKRSLLQLVPNNFSGSMYTNVRMKAKICKPVKGNVVECEVEKINKMGLLAIYPPLSVIIPRSFHPNKDAFKDIEIGDKIKVEVIGTRFEINWDHIDVIARLYNPSKSDFKKKKTDIKIIESTGPQVDLLEDMSDISDLDDDGSDVAINEDEIIDDDTATIDEEELVIDEDDDILEDVDDDLIDEDIIDEDDMDELEMAGGNDSDMDEYKDNDNDEAELDEDEDEDEDDEDDLEDNDYGDEDEDA